MVSEVGEKVRNFYNKTPFPDYELERFNSKDDLIFSMYPFAKILDRSIPASSSIIDVGTGTGQLSAFLSLRRKCVYGIDFSDSSLKKAVLLKNKLRLSSLKLKKINILNLDQINSINKKFDYVLCLGVLHHTENPYQGFKNIVKLLNPGGYIAVGLYNKMGRIPLKVRRYLVKTIFKNNNQIKDYFIKLQIGDIQDKERARGWWNDQYLHPYESSHTLGEVLKWFKLNNIEYIQTVPSSNFFDMSELDISGVWNKSGENYPYFPIGSLKQLSWIWKTHREGGYWITFGKLREVI